MIKRIAVFCGANKGNDPIYEHAAVNLTQVLFQNHVGIVFGGGKVGLMGVIADEMMRLGGEAIGVIPEKLKAMEVGHEGITELHVVDTMHQRKEMMANLSDGFIAIPGGIGTMEEIIEVFTWMQIGYHTKPCALLNVNGYFDHFIAFMDKMVEDGFLKQEQRDKMIIEEDAEWLLTKILESLKN
ncbi:MAG: TIGR00730 family Rossman fold protein [Cyclobacteriaceae bacterium]